MTTVKRQLLTAKELAEHLTVPVSWIRKRTMTDEARKVSEIRETLPHVRIGGCVRYDLGEVERALRSQAPKRKYRPSPFLGKKRDNGGGQ